MTLTPPLPTLLPLCQPWLRPVARKPNRKESYQMETCSIKIQIWRLVALTAHPASSGLSCGESLLNSKKQEGLTQRKSICRWCQRSGVVATSQKPQLLQLRQQDGLFLECHRSWKLSRGVSSCSQLALLLQASSRCCRHFYIITRRRWRLWWNQASPAMDDLLQRFLLGILLS